MFALLARTVALLLVCVCVVTLAGCDRGMIMANHQQDATWTPRTTPGPQASFVQEARTTADVNQQGASAHPAVRFSVHQPIYVLCVVRGVKEGDAHRLSVRWLLNGALVPVSGAHSSILVTRNGPVAFTLTYPLPGDGAAKLYWDEPIGDNNDAANDAFLAQVVAFNVQ
jgi:hypothetical protein